MSIMCANCARNTELNWFGLNRNTFVDNLGSPQLIKIIILCSPYYCRQR